MDEVICSYTMIALHLRDSTMHLVTSSQKARPGDLTIFGESSFRGPCTRTSLQPLLIISATSIGSGVIHLFNALIINTSKYIVKHFCANLQKLALRSAIVFANVQFEARPSHRAESLCFLCFILLHHIPVHPIHGQLLVRLPGRRSLRL